MTDLDLLHFEQLKNKVQAEFLKENTPSYDDISKWKGIDIIYFQEDLRKKAKGNISEKSFYTYFKNSPVTKLPRIDMLNLLSIYAGYSSWYDFKKQHLFANELLSDDLETDEQSDDEEEIVSIEEEKNQEKPISTQKIHEFEAEKGDLQNSIYENQLLKENSTSPKIKENTDVQKSSSGLKKYAWATISSILVVLVGILGFKDKIFDTTYTYCFKDADRNSPIQNELEIKVIKENESPLFYRIKQGECFNYPTKDKILRMEISSPVYENLTISRNLENAPKEETIELNPDDYKMAVLYFSKKDLKGNEDEQNAQLLQKRNQLESLIRTDAAIYQVFDSEIYGLETLTKQKYITLVTTPTTSLKNLNVIEMKKDKNDKIVLIKFKINSNEKTN